MTSQKYPGWMIEKQDTAGFMSYLMSRTGCYVIEVAEIDGTWTGSLRQKISRSGDLMIPIRPFSGSVADCIAEVDRRAASAARADAYRSEPWGAEARKLRGDMSRQPGTWPGRARFARAI